ncbi:MAG: 50S ribosomal protein L24 [Nitrososphaerales archaeon]
MDHELKLIRSSSKPVKVRKQLSNNPARDKSASMLRAALSSDLKSRYGRNSTRIRTGDSVKLIRGEYSGVEGKVEKVFPSEGRLTIEGVTREKIAGGTTKIRIHSSNVVVTAVTLDDKFRRRKLEGTS